MKGIVAPLIKLIVFGVVTVVATSMLALTISNSGADGKSNYSGVFNDVTMLNVGDDVRIAGVRVGQITEVSVHDDNMAMVRFNVDREELPEGTQLRLKYRNLTGLRYLSLERGAGEATATVRPGHVFTRPDTHAAVNLTELFNGFRPLFRQLSAEDVNTLAEQILNVFQGDGAVTSATMSRLVSDTASLTNTLADRDQVIGELIDNLTTVLDTVNRNEEQFTSLLDNTEQLVTGLAEQRGSVGSAIGSVSNLTAVTASILGPTRPAIQGGIAGLRDVSDRITDQDDEITEVLENMPVKLQKIGRLASFGAWFQFYACGLDIVAGEGRSTVLTRPIVPLPDINHVLYTSAATRCWADGDPTG